MDNILSITVFGDGVCYHSSLEQISNKEELPVFDKVNLIPGTKPILFLELMLILYNSEGQGIQYLRRNVSGTESVVLKSINREIKNLVS